MPNEETDIKEVLRLLAIWIAEIRLNNSIYWYDTNKASEPIALKLLNLIYALKLEDLNEKSANFPGLDLGDSTKKIAFQVTSRVDANKIIATLRMVIKKEYQNSFTGGIKFLILNNEKIEFKRITPESILSTFNPETDIIYLDELSKEIKKIYESDEVRFLKIKQLLEKQFVIQPATQDIFSSNLAAIVEQYEKKIDDLNREQNLPTDLEGKIDFVKDLDLPDQLIISKRIQLVEECLRQIKSAKNLWIYGNISTGKTQLAQLIGKSFEQNAYWVDLEDLQGENFFKELLLNLCASFGISMKRTISASVKDVLLSVGPNNLLLLNNVPKFSGSESSKTEFISLLEQAAKYNVHIVITSIHQPFLHLKDSLRENLCVQEIPPFKDEETYEVLKYYGADDTFANEYKIGITVLTDGHPFILRTACHYLNQNNWDLSSHTFLAIFKNEYGQEFNSEIYSRIVNSIEDEQTKSLLYRLSLIKGTFGQDAINTVANANPVIDSVHEKSQRLNGIWLQETEKNKFKLSPLIKHLGSNLTEGLKLDINRKLGDLILSKKIFSQIEAVQAINYYRDAKDFGKLALVLTVVLRESLKIPELFFDWGFQFYWYYNSLPQEISPFFKVFIRFLQINISIQHQEELDYLITDLESIIRTEDAGVLGNVIGNLMLCFFYSKKHPTKALNYFVKSKNQLHEADKSISELVFPDKEFNQAIWLGFYELRTKEQFVDWFAKFKEISNSLSEFSVDNDEGYILAGHSLNQLTNLSTQSLSIRIETLNFIMEAALATGLPLIAAYAIKYIIQVKIVHSSDFDSVKKLLDERAMFLHQHPIYKFLAYDEYGRQLFYHQKKNGSLDVLSQIIDIPLPQNYIEGLDALLVYSQLIAPKDEKVAHHFILKALERVNVDKHQGMFDRARIYGEAGISFWLIGDNKQSIYNLAKGYELLLNDFNSSPDQQAAVIRFGHIINYVRGLIMDGIPPEKTADGQPYAPPLRGVFYFTTDKLLEGHYYYDERKFMVSTILEDSFEFLGDLENAKKWAFKSIEISLSLKSPEYAPILYKSLYYLIIDRNYTKAINLFLYLEKYLKEVQENNNQEVSASLKEIVKKNNIVTEGEHLFYYYLIIPIVITVIEDISNIKIKQADYPSFINQLFETIGQKINDKNTFLFIKQIFESALINKTPMENADAFLNSYSGEYQTEVQIIGHLLFSINADALHALRFQLPHMPNFDKIYLKGFPAFYHFTIAPFLENFWLNKFKSYKEQFSEKQFWGSKSKPRFTDAAYNKKLQYLFQALVHHLNVPTSSAIDNWLDSSS